MTTLSISAQLLRTEAEKRGIECLTVNDEHLIFMSKNGKRWQTMGSRTSLQSSVGKTIADEKALTKKLLQHFAIPTAKYCIVSSIKDMHLLDALAFPLVMKPTVGCHGDGVIVGIKNSTQALAAFTSQNKEVIFEEQLVGRDYRIVCVDYVMVAAACRKPAFVTGDDIHTIEELIELKNSDKNRSFGTHTPLKKIVIDELVTSYLQEQNCNLQTIPQLGQEIFLRKTANLSTGGEAENVTDQVSPENKLFFESIARLFGLNTVGMDVMCSSLSVPISQQAHAGIIELNDSPGLRMHHFPSVGSPINVAGKILDMVEREYA